MFTPAACLGPFEIEGLRGTRTVRAGDRFENRLGKWEVVGFTLDEYPDVHIGKIFKSPYVNCKWLGIGKPPQHLKPTGPDGDIVQFFGWSVADDLADVAGQGAR